jgi:molybdopterin synthase catalytic subunit
MIAVSNETIEVADLLDKLGKQGAGSVVLHIGVVKPDPEGRRSSGITFGAGGDLEAELLEIENSVRERFRLVDVVLARRLGRLGIGDVILFAAVSANDRENAFGACRALVERCKKMKALEKEEHYED